MTDCYWSQWNEGICRCENLACNGKCYKLENLEAEGRALRVTCKWQNPKVLKKVEAVQEKIRIDLSKLEEEPCWLRLGWGLIQCSHCGEDFPASARIKRKCPRCKSVWVNNKKESRGRI